LSNLDEAHRRPRHRFCDRSGIDHIVLVGLDVRFHKLSRDDFHRVAHCLQFAREPLRTGATLHADDRSGCVGEIMQEAVAAELGLPNRLTGDVQTDHVKVVLTDIDSIYRNFFHWPLHDGLLPVTYWL
jgi:hypothetical protein